MNKTPTEKKIDILEKKIAEQKELIKGVPKKEYHRIYDLKRPKNKQDKERRKFKKLYGKYPTPRELENWIKGRQDKFMKI